MRQSKDRQGWSHRLTCLKRYVIATAINHLKRITFFSSNGGQRQTKTNKSFKLKVSFIFCKPWIWSYKSRHAVRGLECEMEHSGNVSQALNVYASVCVCVCVCVCNSSSLAWDRCTSRDRTIPVIAQPVFYYHVIPSQSHLNTGKQVRQNNHQSLCALRLDLCQLQTHTHEKKKKKTRPKQQKEQSVFLEDSPIFPGMFLSLSFLE